MKPSLSFIDGQWITALGSSAIPDIRDRAFLSSAVIGASHSIVDDFLLFIFDCSMMPFLIVR
ncbi:hypothetical protein HYU19_00890 [Candidatus Woesearchaeota archaeon]|nr:hypothetical protein [Candidatus Woesearchaeota archaeon]